tara:strand:- start:183 stop:302 length:120 start_codon:yes stop_codon:yes gene_type:complete
MMIQGNLNRQNTSRSLSVVNSGGRKGLKEGIDMLEAKYL